jgi:sigma-B regulation protein RsbU (phosphoserine phosphatase)
MKSPKIWRQLPLSRQLLIAVNSVLLIVVTLFVVVDHRMRIVRHLDQTRLALSEEAKTLYEAAVAVNDSKPGAVQKLVDDVCARMNTEDSPGHHIMLQWQGEVLQAKSHGRASPEMVNAMIAAATDVAGPQPMAKSMVVGDFAGPGGTVYVSEKRSNLIATARKELLRQLIALALTGAVAALVVTLVLYLVVTKPMRKLVTSLRSIGDGNLDSRTQDLSCRELRYLSDQINVMVERLDTSDRDRRLHMTKAREIPQHLRPSPQDLEKLDVAELFEPAEDVGGDYFDVIPLGKGRTLLCLADVVGHGVPAAMAATLIKAFVVEASKQSQCPAQILNYVNRHYSEIMVPGYFATMVILVIDGPQQRLTYANAGHEPPFLQSPDGTINRLGGGDIILGVDEDVNYQAEHASFSSASKLVILSDGVTETMNGEDEQFGTDRVIAILNESCKLRVNEVVHRFTKELTMFRDGTPAFDDTTLLVAQIT